VPPTHATFTTATITINYSSTASNSNDIATTNNTTTMMMMIINVIITMVIIPQLSRCTPSLQPPHLVLMALFLRVLRKIQ
jgi:SNF family Na+-dependent transporter